jgi:hypothetical protein
LEITPWQFLLNKIGKLIHLWSGNKVMAIRLRPPEQNYHSTGKNGGDDLAWNLLNSAEDYCCYICS